MNILNLKNVSLDQILNRQIETYNEQEKIVNETLSLVQKYGDRKILDDVKKFDKADLVGLEVSEKEIQNAFQNVDDEFIDILTEAKENIESFHKMQVKSGFEIDNDGIQLGQRYTPIERVGIYVPGGTASYPSTVLMNTIPAKIAGVSEIVMTTPPDANGKIMPEILVAARLCGVDKIYKCGGASAIAGLAYGTETIKKVDKIVGPGNIFVALAKKAVFGVVGIDMVAGPSEILVVADENADAKNVAGDLLSQAEHDKLATAVLLTDSEVLAQSVDKEIDRQLSLLNREDIARCSINKNGKIIVCENIEKAIEISNEIAPEHLEIYLDNPKNYLNKIKNAGSIFLGKYTPEALGDYFAGPNHTLPTSGSAKFSSPLSVDDFVKKSSYIYYPKEKLESVKDKINKFANREGLQAHGQSVLNRF